MGATGRLASIMSLAGLIAATAAQAQPQLVPPPPPPPPADLCAPEKLFRATVRNITPGLAAADRAAQPRQIWRQGTRFLRTVEQPVPPSGDQTVMIVAEPDIWMINEATRTGRHAVDPGPTLEVKAPILPVARDLPRVLHTLEYGCEPQFVATHTPRPQGMVAWGAIRASVHTYAVGDHSVAILMDARRNEPLMLSYLRAGSPVFVLRYDEYRHGLPDRPQLFEPPKGVKLTEAGRQASPPELD